MKSLITHKSALTKRRLAIIFIICTIITVSVATGFSSGFNSDPTVYTPDGARIVMYADAPESGTPEDYDAISALKFTAQNIYKASFFRGDTQGSCIADIGMGMKYDQNVVNTRVIHGDVMYQEAVSISAAKKSANQRYIEGDRILYRPSVGVKNNLPLYSDQVTAWTVDEYYANYGAFPKELSKYVITPKTILSVRDNNAATPALAADAKNDGADEGEPSDENDENDPNVGELTCDVPQKLVRGEDGYYTFTITLDPESSSRYYRNEVKSLASATKHPVFLFVELSIKIDENFYPVSVTTTESYDILIPVLGALTCTGTLTETFSSINTVGEVPEQEFFRSKFDNTDNGDIVLGKDASEYLIGAFDPYINGEKKLDLSANIDVDGIALNNVKLSADIKTMNIRAAYSGTYIEYTGDRVYLTLNDIKGYISVDKVKELIQNDALKALLAGVSLPDFGSYIGPNTLNDILGGCEVQTTDGVACVSLPFSLGEGDGKITVDAKLYIDDESNELLRIEGGVRFGGMSISLKAKTATSAFPEVNDGYECLDGILDLVPDIAELIASDALELSGFVKTKIVKGGIAADVELGIGGYVDLSDAKNVRAQIDLDYNGIKPTVKYVGGTVYVELGNILLKAKASELGGLVDTVKRLTGFEIPQSLLDLIAAFKPTTVADYLNILQSIEVTDNGLNAKLMFATIPATLSLQKTATAHKLDISVSTNALKDMTLDLNATLAVHSSEKDGVELEDEGAYVDTIELTPAIESAVKIAQSGALSANVRFELDGKAYFANIQADFSDKANVKFKLTEPTLPLSVTVIGTTAYIEVAGDKYDAKLSGELADAKALVEMLDKYIPENVKPILDTLFAEEKPQIDAVALINEALAAITSLSLDGDVLTATITYGDVVATLTADTGLRNISVAAEFGGKQINICLDGMIATADISEPTGEFVPVSDFTSMLRTVVPLLDAEGLDLAICAEAFGINISGNIAVSFGETTLAEDGTESYRHALAVHAALFIGDVPVDIYLKDGKAYLALSGTAAFELDMSEAAVSELFTKLQAAIPDIDLSQAQTAIELMFDPMRLLDAKVSLLPVADGFALSCDLGGVGIDAAFTLTVDTTDADAIAMTMAATVASKTLSADITLETTDGTLDSIGIAVGGNELAEITIADIDAQTVTVPNNDYIPAAALIDYIKPIRSLISDAANAKSLTLDLSAYTLDEMNSSFDIAGSIKISLEKPLCIDGAITLFASSPDSEKIYIKLADGKLYLATGSIKLYFDLSSDSARLYEIIKQYLPEYLAFEIGKLLGQEDGYLPAGISPVFDAVNTLLEMQETDSLVSTLFDGVYGAGGDSVLKILLDALHIGRSTNKLTFGVSVLGMTLNVTPDIENDKLTGVSAGVNIGPMFVGASAAISFSDKRLSVSAPGDAAEYVSIMDFIDVIQNAVSTVTATDKDGNIAFEVDTFDFDYKIYAIEMQKDADGNNVLDADGNPIPVTDDAGREKPLLDANGNKVVDTVISVTEKPGEKALKVKFVKTEHKNELEEVTKTSYRFNLEAHVVLSVSSLKNSSPLTLDLYVINDDANPDGVVFLDYLESNGNGERIKLEYRSIMQILAAAMDIIGVSDDTMNMLLGDYRLDIDKTVFESMDIAGIDGLRDMIDGLASAIESGKSALGDVSSAWELVDNAGNVEKLIERRETITELLKSGIDKLKAVLALFSKDDEQIGSRNDGQSGAELYSMIVNAVKFGSGSELDADGAAIPGKTYLQAEIDNAIATQTSGTSFVKVSQTEQNGKTVLDRIEVRDLDVNTKLLETFDMSFKAGTDISIALPDGYDKTDGNRTYSDFGQVKHLLFDVMNTANMLEFEMGDANNATDSNKIELGIKLLGVESIKVAIRYNVKVRIIDRGEGANPRFKTAALVELVYKDCKAAGAAVFPNCTTRLYFYDNVIYVRGVEWYVAKENWLGKTWATRDVNVAYTVEQLGAMMSADGGMTKFLNEFVFYLLPMSRSFTFVKIDLQGKIAESVASPSTGADPAPTVATVFKGYTYDGSTHSMTIGLSELAEAPDSDMLGDVKVDITGKNDGDDNILDNYISGLTVDTSLVNSGACTINVRLRAELRNAETFIDTDNVQKLRSSGLTVTTDGYSLEGVLENLIPSTAWNYIWA